MADHDELVAEMPVLETMGTQERQKLAKKRRLQQLKRWGQREKEWIAKEKQLNKRLANIMSEENNGLNLKQYTTYNSNQRTKKKLMSNDNSASNGNTKQNEQIPNSGQLITNGAGKNEFNNNGTNGLYSNSNLQPNGRVHFNVGVMLLEAAARNDFEEVKRLLSLGVSPDSVNHDGLTALHQCCIDASEPIMQLLLSCNANVDARDSEQWTPLHAACTCGHLNLVKILVEHGADLLAVNGDGNMPFDICEDEATLDYIESQMVKQGITQEMIDLTRASTEMNMLDDLEKLASSQADLNEADEHGVTRLHIAATNNYLSAVKFLLNHGVNVNVCDNDLWRPLHGVACWGNEQHIKIVELLVEAGANLDARTLNEETVFDLCDNVEILERLNQLKDELESKQATGTGKLRRTQSRTNSRVHSVRRTSVRDKNQISRREAREEAMLRVDNNNSETPSESALTVESSIADGKVNGRTEMVESPILTNSDNSSLKKIEGGSEPEPNKFSQPKVTNLDDSDDIQQGSDRDSQANVEQILTRSQNSETLTIESSKQPEQLLAEPISRARVTGTRLLEMDSNDEQWAGARRQQQPPSAPSAVKINMIQQNGAPTTQHQICDPTTTMQANNQQQKHTSTTTVQVQFAPTNYTLSNLKKHRSDMRMRSCSVAGGVSTTSLNTTDGYSGQKLTISNGTSLETSALIVAARETVRLDPEPVTADSLPTRLNGATHRPESPSSTFKKFHGEPSEVIGGKSSRKLGYKCCNVI